MMGLSRGLAGREITSIEGLTGIEIQKGVDSLNTSGGYLFLGRGEYTIDRTINVPSKVGIFGEPGATILTLGSKVDSIIFHCSGNTNSFRDLIINGNSGLQSSNIDAYGILFKGGSFFKVENCFIYNIVRDGIWLSGCTNSIIKNNNLINCGRYGIVLSNNSTENLIEGNYLSGCLYNILNQINCHRNRIIGNHAVAGSYDGIYLNGTSTGTVEDCMVGNNIVINNKRTGIALDFCINNTVIGNVASGNGTDGLHFEVGSFNNCTGNTTRNNSRDGIRMEITNGGVINSNISEYNAAHGISILTTGINIAIIGNTIGSNLGDGILIQSLSTAHTISDNICFNNGSYGIEIRHATCGSAILIGNIMLANTIGGMSIQATAGSSCISGNNIYS